MKRKINVAFTLKIDSNGQVEWTTSLANNSKTTGDYLLAISDGFLAVGTFDTNDQDFTGIKTYGKEDIYIAHYSKDGTCLNISSYGGDGKDNPEGIIPGAMMTISSMVIQILIVACLKEN